MLASDDESQKGQNANLHTHGQTTHMAGKSNFNQAHAANSLGILYTMILFWNSQV